MGGGALGILQEQQIYTVVTFLTIFFVIDIVHFYRAHPRTTAKLPEVGNKSTYNQTPL